MSKTDSPDKKESKVQRKVFQSSLLQSGVYNPERRELILEFVSGPVYAYSNFSPEAWVALNTAASPGSYFHQFIKPVFPGRRMDG